MSNRKDKFSKLLKNYDFQLTSSFKNNISLYIKLKIIFLQYNGCLLNMPGILHML